MSYFRNFPFIVDYQIQGKQYTGMDITRRTGVPFQVRNDWNSHLMYEVREGETPEMLADRVYDDSGLYWVILMFNEIHDVEDEWPLDHHSFDRMIDRKYGSVDRNNIHHYLSAASGAIVDSDHVEYDRVPITNYEYEMRLNDSKRKVKIPDPSYIGSITSSHRKKIKE